jgi:hypothetical protein
VVLRHILFMFSAGENFVQPPGFFHPKFRRETSRKTGWRGAAARPGAKPGDAGYQARALSCLSALALGRVSAAVAGGHAAVISAKYS